MPYDYSTLKQRLKQYDEQLHSLFNEQENAHELQNKIKSVQNYYELSYTRARSIKTVEAIVDHYQLFIEQLTQIGNGTLDPQEALDTVRKAKNSRKITTLFYTLAKACEFLFLASATCSIYAAFVGLAIPLLMLQPVLGVAVGITVLGSMLAVGYKAFSCLMEFKTWSRHSTEYIQEISLIHCLNKHAPDSLIIKGPAQDAHALP